MRKRNKKYFPRVCIRNSRLTVGTADSVDISKIANAMRPIYMDVVPLKFCRLFVVLLI